MDYKRSSVGNGYSTETWKRIMTDTGHANGGPVRRLSRQEIEQQYGVTVSRRFGPRKTREAAPNQSPAPPNTKFETPTHSDPATEQTRKVVGDSASETRVGAAISAGDRGHRP